MKISKKDESLGSVHEKVSLMLEHVYQNPSTFETGCCVMQGT